MQCSESRILVGQRWECTSAEEGRQTAAGAANGGVDEQEEELGVQELQEVVLVPLA